ncbi:MAG: DUF429 domain-containing protein [Cyanobacteria bacterium SZAS LIN-3]|nr:DUF429 domain-containing protein [Cyanobacteria bacterium SZAS LIN-3]
MLADAHLTTFAGADYSAARQQPNATWLALGKQAGGKRGNVLAIYKLENVGSDRLGEALVGLGGAPDHPQTQESPRQGRPVCAGLDYPFGWPREFVEYYRSQNSSDIASVSKDRDAVFGDPANFEDLDALVRAFGREPKTLAGRLISPKAASPLHRINPGLLKMAWQGRQMLRFLRQKGWAIPPFDGPLEDFLPENRSIAMEVYPAATLCAAGLPFRKYKGSTPEARTMREQIITGLTRLHTVKAITAPDGMGVEPTKLAIPPTIAAAALGSDDALDAVLACYSAFLATLMPRLCDPKLLTEDRLTPQIEGWIYTPYGF